MFLEGFPLLGPSLGQCCLSAIGAGLPAGPASALLATLHRIKPGALCPYSEPPSKYEERPHLVVTSPPTDLTSQGKCCLTTLLDPGSKWPRTNPGSLCHKVHSPRLWVD